MTDREFVYIGTGFLPVFYPTSSDTSSMRSGTSAPIIFAPAYHPHTYTPIPFRLATPTPSSTPSPTPSPLNTPLYAAPGSSAKSEHEDIVRFGKNGLVNSLFNGMTSIKCSCCGTGPLMQAEQCYEYKNKCLCTNCYDNIKKKFGL